MSMASLTITVVAFINIFLFLAAPGNVNSPMLDILKTLSTGDFDIFFIGRIIVEIGVIGAFILWVSNIVLYPAGSVLGGSPFNITMLPLVFGLSAFIVLCAIPNIGAMGIPSPLAEVIESIFGLMLGLAILGFFKGE